MAPSGVLTIRRANAIWHEPGGWFDARWHFSFDRYRDPKQMGVGALRVFNDNRIVAGAEYPSIRTRTSSRTPTSCRATSSARTRWATTAGWRAALPK